VAASGFLPLVEMTDVGLANEYRNLIRAPNRHFDRREKSRGVHALTPEWHPPLERGSARVRHVWKSQLSADWTAHSIP